MAEIEIIATGARKFRVEIGEGGRRTSHLVSVPERLADGTELPADDLERAVRESLRFLLEREPSSSILARFSLDDITRYFPEYPDEIARRLR